MRTSVLSIVITLFAVPATADAIQGSWATNPEHCTGIYPETRVKIAGNKIKFIETTCTLANPTNLRGMPDAKLYDLNCSGEGETWSERTLIGISGGNLLIYNQGLARTYPPC